MKKIASLLLTALMLAAMLTVFVLPASAEGEEVKKPETATWFVDNHGDPVWWELTDNKTVLPDGKTGRTLTIGGKGNMPRFNALAPRLDKRPWKDYIETITTVVIDSGVTGIGDCAFFGCTNLTSVTIPSSVTSIGDSAFRDCKSLQSVTIPSSVTSIGGNAFQGCASLQSVTIPSSVTTIGDSAFRDCASLQSVTIPSSVTSIVGSAFYGCASLQSVTIPSSVTRIESSAFNGCASLQSVTIPSSVTSIKSDAFAHCTSLQSVTIPYGVVSIGQSAFQNCTSLQSVTIPSSVTRIDGCAFYSCDQLASVTVKTSTPPTLGQKAFDCVSDDLAIYVPCGAGTAYQEAWCSYRDQIKEAYVVDDQPGKNGTITFDKDCFPKETYTEPSETVTVTVMPADGYRLKADSLLVTYKDENGEEKTADLTQDETDPMKYTFTMPCSNVTVTAEFEKIADESEPAPTASVFSEGSLTIICTIAAAVVFGLGGFFLGTKKKKKPAVASCENTDEE